MFKFNRENISLIFSFISLVLSISNTAYLFFTNRKKINVIYQKHLDCRDFPGKSMLFKFVIENKSRSKISITRMFLTFSDEKLEFDALPISIYNYNTKTGDIITSSVDVYSQSLPIDIDGLCSSGGFFEIENFPFEKFSDCNFINLEIFTTRGKVLKKLFIPRH